MAERDDSGGAAGQRALFTSAELEMSLRARERAVRELEVELGRREAEAEQRGLQFDSLPADLRLANEHLVLANLRSLMLADETSRLYADASKAMREKNEFFVQVSHELRSPLASITGWAYILGQDPDATTITEAARSIASSARTQAQLVNDLLDMSRIMTSKFELDPAEIDLADVVVNAVYATRPLAATKRVSLRVMQTESVMIRGDATRLSQVIENLLSNALKFTSSEGEIEVRLTVEGGMAVLALCDNGEGIAAEFLPFVFDQHAQAYAGRFGGLGLGLSIVRHIVELHGGTVTAQSEGRGKGATFVVRLPRIGGE